MRIATYVAWRLVQLLPVLLGMSVVVFFLIHLIPGDPARQMLGIRATPQAVAALHHRWALDQPLPVQYVLFLERLLHGDLGDSLFYRVPAATLIIERLPATIWLLSFTVVFSIAITVPLAMLAATHKDRFLDQAIRAIPLVGMGMPPFWVGIMLILLFALVLRIFPVGGFGTATPEHLHSIVLPALTIAIAITPMLIRSLRASMLGVLEAEFVATARSKGISELRVLLRHVVRNAVIPTVTVLGVNIGFLVGSTVIIETVFALPGIGNLMIQAIVDRDFPVVQGVTLLFAIMVTAVNLATDIGYAVLDPRVSL
jgi:peptide/nickel transport system permease protein